MLPESTLRRPRSLFAIILVTLCMTLFLSYTRIISSSFLLLQEVVEPSEVFQAPVVNYTEQERKDYSSIFKGLPPMSYGTAQRPPMTGMPDKLVDSLPEELVPAVASSYFSKSPAQRLVFVGDVHGHKKALEDLLAKVAFDRSKGDHLIFTGDLVNKGPDSAGVVALAMELGAHAVRGNHEDRILLTHAAMAAENAVDVTEALNTFKIEGDEEEGGEAADPRASLAAYKAAEASLSKGDRRDRETARSLSPDQIAWLAGLPLVLQVGAVPAGASDPAFENVLVCHAGLVPNVSLEDQDPWAVMNMRTIVYPLDELRRDAVREYLVQKARRLVGGNRGALASAQLVDEATVTREMEKILKMQGLEGRQGGDAGLPSSGREGFYWYEEWSRFQEQLAKKAKKEQKEDKKKKNKQKSKAEDAEDAEAEKHRKERQPVTTVVYGHDAKSGLRVPREYGKGKKGYTFGLDSGCVYGKNLTALVIKVKKDKAVHEIVQVDCEQAVDLDD